MPRINIAYPSWLTVEYARSRLMSSVVNAIVAARKAVEIPMYILVVKKTGTEENIGWILATR